MLPFSPFDVALITRVMLGNPLSLAFASAACARLLIYIVLLGRSIAHRVGLLCQRVGEASHPGPSGDIDPWASYLEKKRRDPTSSSSKAIKGPARSLWIDCEIDLTQFQDGLVKLTPDIFAENSTGVILLSRPMFANLCRIRSKKPLVAVLPGGRNDDLPSLGFAESSYAVHHMFIKDPALDKWSRKLTTIVQLGAVPALPSSLEDAPEWTVSDNVEFSATLSQRLFASPEDWSSFISSCRKSVPAQVFGLHADLNSSCVGFYGWTRFDKSNHRVFFRAPTAHKTLILSASGLRLNFIVQEVCRDTQSKQARDANSTVVWLGKRSFADATLLIKQVDSHLGLALSQQSFGLRVPVDALAAVRKLVSPDDSRFQASNSQVRGRFQFEVVGLPPECSRSDVITNFAAWKHGDKTGWAVIPLQHWFVNGQSHWLVSSDIEPQCHFLHLKNARVLIQKHVPAAPGSTRPASKPPRRPDSGPNAPRAASQPRPAVPRVPQTPSSSVPSNADLLQRVIALETQASQAQLRHDNLEKKIDSNFAAVLARLDALPARGSRASSPSRRSVERHTGETPDPKVPRVSPQALTDK